MAEWITRHRVVAAKRGSGEEVVAAPALAQCVDLDAACFVAGEDQASAMIEERLEPDVEVHGRGD
jgi:hypothetical protein